MPVAEHLTRGCIHRPPATQDLEGLGKRIVAIAEVGEQKTGCARGSLRQTSADRRPRAVRLAGDIRGSTCSPVRARLLDTQSQTEDARMDLSVASDKRAEWLESPSGMTLATSTPPSPLKCVERQWILLRDWERSAAARRFTRMSAVYGSVPLELAPVRGPF